MYPKRYTAATETPLDLTCFKQVKVKPAKYQCLVCADGGFIMSKLAAQSHSMEVEHRRKAKDKRDLEWAAWNAASAEWATVAIATKGAEWGAPTPADQRNQWILRDEDREWEMKQKQKRKDILEWAEAVAVAVLHK